MVNGTDAKFLSKVQQMHGSHKHYIMPKRNNCPDPDTRNCFGVVHFAGDVFYNVRDFVEKNKVRFGVCCPRLRLFYAGCEGRRVDVFFFCQTIAAAGSAEDVRRDDLIFV